MVKPSIQTVLTARRDNWPLASEFHIQVSYLKVQAVRIPPLADILSLISYCIGLGIRENSRTKRLGAFWGISDNCGRCSRRLRKEIIYWEIACANKARKIAQVFEIHMLVGSVVQHFTSLLFLLKKVNKFSHKLERKSLREEARKSKSHVKLSYFGFRHENGECCETGYDELKDKNTPTQAGTKGS